MTHYDDEALFEYVEGTSPIREEIAAHAASCDDCASEIDSHNDIATVMRTESVWDETIDREAPPAERPLAVSFGARLAAEDAAAVELCDQILTGPATWWTTRLRKAEGTRTAGMVRELIERGRKTLEQNPTNSLQISEIAVQLAHDLDIAAYPSDFVLTLRGQALRHHAYALSFMGRPLDALATYDDAQQLFEQIPLPEYELARLNLARATTLRSVDRSAEAVPLARSAAETFRRFGDTTRYLNARLTEGAILLGMGNIAEALEIFLSIEGNPALETTSAVRLVFNIAHCRKQLGHTAEAIVDFRRCAAEFEMLGMETERTRARWSLAHCLIAAGHTRDAVPVLRQAWREFEAMDMLGDSALVALELAEALLLVGEAGQVPAICRDLVARFTAAGSASRAITALSFLREAVALGQAKPSLIREVHTFLQGIRTDRPRLYARPPAGATED